ncbi:MAG: hypothetical protein LBS21_03840 [Clostridiales bacterium]|jgi:hypothetical protein|nr:hypothetical protein [Clostridiales bacterium]
MADEDIKNIADSENPAEEISGGGETGSNPETEESANPDTPGDSAPDTGDPEMPEFIKPRRSIARKLSLRTMYITAASMLLLTAGIVFFAVFFLGNRQTAAFPEGTVFLDVPEPDTESDTGAKYIFTNKTMNINGSETDLLGVLIDTEFCVLYFSRYFDSLCTDFSLSDDNGNTYYMDLSRHIDGEVTNKLYFEPLNEGITYFKLNFPKYVDTGYPEQFFYFIEPLVLPQAKYAENRVAQISYQGSSTRFCIDEIAFTGSGSFISYSFSSEGDGIRLIPRENAKPNIFLTYGNLFAPKMSGYDLYADIENANVLGLAAFATVRQPSKTAQIAIRGLNCQIDLSKTVEPGELFLNHPDHTAELDFNNYKLVLERMGVRGNVYALILHTVDTNLPAPKDEEDFSNRVYAAYDIELTGKTVNGEEVTLKPEAYVSAKGSDYVFIDEEHKLAHTANESLRVKINSVEFEMEDVVYNFDLTNLKDSLSDEKTAVNEAISAYFKEKNETAPFYTAQVAASSINGNEINAVVYEAGLSVGGTAPFTGKYAVTGKYENGKVVIVSNEQLQQ